MIDPRDAADRLRASAESGELRALCERHGVSLLVLFGSAARTDSTPNDVDLAVRFETDAPDVLGFLDDLSEVAGTSRLDLMDLGSAGPVARERALVGGQPLVERTKGLFARTQLAAIMEWLDTAWLRRLDLKQMAG